MAGSRGYGRRRQIPTEEVSHCNRNSRVAMIEDLQRQVAELTRRLTPPDLGHRGQVPAEEVPYLGRNVLDLSCNEQFPAEEVQHCDWDDLGCEEENHDTNFSIENPCHHRDSIWEWREDRHHDLGFIVELPEYSGTSQTENIIDRVNEVETPSEPVYDDYDMEDEVEELGAPVFDGEFGAPVSDKEDMEEEQRKPVYDNDEDDGVLYGDGYEMLVIEDEGDDRVSINIFHDMNMLSDEPTPLVVDPSGEDVISVLMDTKYRDRADNHRHQESFNVDNFDWTVLVKAAMEWKIAWGPSFGESEVTNVNSRASSSQPGVTDAGGSETEDAKVNSRTSSFQLGVTDAGAFQTEDTEHVKSVAMHEISLRASSDAFGYLRMTSSSASGVI